MSDSGGPGQQLGHPADPGRGQVGSFGAAAMATGVQKNEMCVFAAPARNKKGPLGEGVIMHSDRSCVLTAPAHKKEQQGAGQKDEICVFAAPAHKRRGRTGPLAPRRSHII